jgi:hypothetical protein
MADGGIGNQSPATLFQARLNTANGVSNTLTLGQYIGNKVVVSGLTVPIPSAGLTRNIADNLINASGADAGAPPAASTLYYVYISNSRATFSPSSIRLSAQAPTLVNGVKYLGNSGNALNWRFVGWVRPNATPQFESSLKNRLIVNYYNRIVLDLFSCPNYVNDNAATTYVFSGTSYAPINGGVDDTLSFISNGEDSVDVDYSCTNVTSILGVGGRSGIGVDSTTTAKVAQLHRSSADTETMLSMQEILPEGLRSLVMLFVCPTGGTSATIFADDMRNGSTADPAVTYISAAILG